ncbi:DUF4388 domain-containing protein [Nostoc parmelioides]|uniref:DUF4388 domain-containing protein n=1 Tax=Nostoc parmelioides FACHB-3921 TaxID=2692909 RepID=A0ABR8BKN9_9NOSO|nr:DUF4388 domain-containing protein [Nostoc parmelioides]MBD2254431.1 DUF4388 domain-containing protein [Nostoc parmelioides FACHB-3921]
MAIAGTFSDFSLPELLQFLDQGKKTGILYIEVSQNTSDNKKAIPYYVWLHQGRIIAAADRLDQKCLTLMIDQRGWISERVISRVNQISSNSINTPLGLVLKVQGLLQPEQLKLLFNNQILRPICNLFQIRDGVFKFNQIQTLPLPLAEMTGLSMSANEVTLTSLRLLRDWSALADKLPDPTSSLSGLSVKEPQIHLKAQEWQVWEFVNGNVSIQDIAHQLQIPVEIVQQIAYRLIVVGLIEENFMATSCALPNPTITEEEAVPEPGIKTTVSQSFLNSLVGFLRSRS